MEVSETQLRAIWLIMELQMNESEKEMKKAHKEKRKLDEQYWRGKMHGFAIAYNKLSLFFEGT